jgi:dTDP-4-dehydrorhamnose reductase
MIAGMAGTTISRVLVTGSGSQLAAFIISAFADCEVIALPRLRLDVTDKGAVRDAVASASPDLIVNCASFNDVDGAEDRPEEALAVNALGVRSLAGAAQAAGAVFVHYSTDFVINCSATEPHEENVPPSPRGVYASSKLLGEWFALQSPRAFVLRVESLFGSAMNWQGRRGTLDNIVEGLERGRDVKVFTDRVVSPSYMPDVAAATRRLVLSGASPGLYHCVNNGHASWHDIAAHVARLLDIPSKLVPITVGQLPLRVPRPVYCALSTAKLTAAGFRMPTWQDGLQRWLRGRSKNPVVPSGSNVRGQESV